MHARLTSIYHERARSATTRPYRVNWRPYTLITRSTSYPSSSDPGRLCAKLTGSATGQPYVSLYEHCLARCRPLCAGTKKSSRTSWPYGKPLFPGNRNEETVEQTHESTLITRIHGSRTQGVDTPPPYCPP
eukprot:3423109-Rhodomonas_salina.1